MIGCGLVKIITSSLPCFGDRDKHPLSLGSLQFQPYQHRPQLEGEYSQAKKREIKILE